MAKPKHKLTQIYDGEWFRPTMRNHYMGCCDCGLVHRLDFRIVNDGVEIRSFRARNYTAARRREMK